MPTFSWRKRHTKYFGEISIPFARIEIGCASGAFQAFAVQVDSGAVTSLLRRSVADLLGIDLESGRRIELTGVGGAKSVAYMHDLPVRFDTCLEVPGVPFAIADSEGVPNLLGRLGVFDRLQIDFDGSLRETRITGPWLDKDGTRILRFVLDTENHILSRWAEHPLADPIDRVLKHFVRRAGQLCAAAAGLVKLHYEFESPLMMRALFELVLQFEYLMQNPGRRANEYLDFTHVSRHREMTEWLKDPNGLITKRLAASPLRAYGQKRVNEQFERVREQFQRSANSYWNKWYKMKIVDLAKAVGREREYRLWYARFSGWTHGDPHTTTPQSIVDKQQTMYFCYMYYANILLRIAGEKQIVLSDEQCTVLKNMAEERFL